MAEIEEEKKSNIKKTKTNFKPGRKPAINTKKPRAKSKPKTTQNLTPKQTQAQSQNKEQAEVKQKIKHEPESEGIQFSHIVIIISLITILILALIIYLTSIKKNKLQEELDNKNNQLQSISEEVVYFREYQDKMDNLIDQASELSDEAHAKDLFILENIQKADNSAKVEISDEDLTKIKNLRNDFIDAYEDLDWEDVSNLLVNGLSSEQRALLEGLKIREITVKDSKDVKYTNNSEVYYEINIVVRKKGNSNYQEGDNTRYLVFKKINEEYKVDLVDKIN